MAEIVGLVPAAGRATRFARLPCSKEVLPLRAPEGGDGRVRVACERLLDGFRAAGARRAFIVLGERKLDIPAYLGDGSLVGLDIAYLTVESSPSTVATIARAAPWLEGGTVAFGFPDILFDPVDALAALVRRQAETDAPVVLGLFPPLRPERVDMVETDEVGRVRRITIKPARTDLSLAWILAVWTAEFTRLLVGRATAAGPGGRELYVGDVLQEAIDDGLDVRSVAFPEGAFVDVGTPEDALAAIADARYWRSPTPTPT